jgi:hypothetical protein
MAKTSNKISRGRYAPGTWKERGIVLKLQIFNFMIVTGSHDKVKLKGYFASFVAMTSCSNQIYCQSRF